MKKHKPRVLNSNTDYTGSLKKVELLKEFIETQSDYLNEEKVIALYGAWGSGKSSIIKSLMEGDNALSEKKYKLLHFEAWEYERDNNLSLSLLDILINEQPTIIKNCQKEICSLKKLFKGVAKSTSFNVGIASIDGGVIVNELQEKEIKSNFQSKKELKKNFNDVIKILKKEKEKLIIFIDDLDRCENHNILNMITSIKHLFTLANDVIFIVALDKNAITQALKIKYGENSDKAEEYLEKVFPLNFFLSNSLDYDRYFDELGIEKMDIIQEENKGFSFTTERDQSIRTTLKEVLQAAKVTTPRKLIKIMNKIKLLSSFDASKKIINGEDNKNFSLFYLYSFYLFTLAEEKKDYYDLFLSNYQKHSYHHSIFNLKISDSDKTSDSLEFIVYEYLEKNYKYINTKDLILIIDLIIKLT